MYMDTVPEPFLTVTMIRILVLRRSLRGSRRFQGWCRFLLLLDGDPPAALVLELFFQAAHLLLQAGYLFLARQAVGQPAALSVIGSAIQARRIVVAFDAVSATLLAGPRDLPPLFPIPQWISRLGELRITVQYRHRCNVGRAKR